MSIIFKDGGQIKYRKMSVKDIIFNYKSGSNYKLFIEKDVLGKKEYYYKPILVNNIFERWLLIIRNILLFY